MADKISNLKKWKNNEKLNARDYVYERDLIKNTVNTIIDEVDANTSDLTTEKPKIAQNIQDITDLQNDKVDKSGDTMTGTLTFATTPSGATRLNLNNNDILIDGKIRDVTFDNGTKDSDAVRYSELAQALGVSLGSGSPNYATTLATNIANKYLTEAELTTDFYTKEQADNLLDNKSDTDHTHPQSDIANLTTDLQTINNTLNALQGAYVLRGVVAEDTDTLIEDQTPLTNYIATNFESRNPETGDVLRDNEGGEWYFDGTNWTFVGQAYIDLEQYYTKDNLDTGQLDDRYYTETELNPVTGDPATTDFETASVLDGRYYTKEDLEPADSQVAGALDDRYYTEDEVDNALTNKIDLDGTNSALSILKYIHSEGVTTDIDYNSDRQILQVATPDGTTLQVGGELWFVNAKTNDTLTHGDPVQFAGTQGDHFLVKKAVGSEIEANQDLFVGIATHDAAINDFVKVTWFGEVDEVATTGWSVGDILYFDKSTSGLTNTEPTTQPIIQVAAVTKAESAPNANDGRILVRPQFISRDAKEVFVAAVAGKYAANSLDNILETLYDKTQAHENDTEAAHAASAISFNNANLPGTIFTENDVQNIIEQFFNTNTNKIKADLIPFQFNDVLQFANVASFPQIGDEVEPEQGKLYIDLETNSLYRWDGAAYQAIIEIQDLTGLSDIPGVGITNPQTTQVLRYNGSAWVNDNLESINEIDDVVVSQVSNGQYLKYDETAGDGGAWVNVELDTPVIDSLDAIEGVNATNPASGDVIRWDPTVGESGAWVLDQISNISDTPPSNPRVGDLWYDSGNLIMYIYYDDGDGDPQWVNTAGGVIEAQVEVLNDLNNVNVPNPTDGQVLTYDDASSEWQAKDATSAEYYTLTIADTDWSGTDPTTAVKTVSGVLATDRPLIDLDLSTVAFADVETKQTEYTKLYRVAATADDEITFYALEAPTESLDILIKVVR